MAGYTRQSTFADGDTITAALFNNEYNQLLNAFSNTGGHKHDGTANEGPVIGLIGDAGETSPNNKVLIDTTNNYIEFYVEVSSAPVQQLYIADGAIVPVTDSDIDLGTTSLRFKDTYTDTITTTGNVDVGGNLTVTGTTTFNGGTITMGDAATDNVVFGADVDSNIIPDDDNTYDLGSSTQEWKDLYIDGVAYLDAINFNGTVITSTATEINLLDGSLANTVVNSKAVVYGSSGELAGTLSTAAQGNITSLGTLTALTVDNITLNSNTITNATSSLILDSAGDLILDVDGQDIQFKDGGTQFGSIRKNGNNIQFMASIEDGNITFHGDDGGSNIIALTLDMSAEGAATFNNKIIATELDISGNVDVDGTLETDALSINGTAVTSTAAELNILDGKAFLDEDDMSSNSATGIASQQSIKAYVDTQITAEDLDITTDSGTIAIDLDSETLTVSGGTGLDSSATGNAVTLAIDSTVATLTGSQTLTNKSLTAPTLTGTAVVASLDISGDIDVDGTTNLDVVDIDGAVDMASTLNVTGAITGTLATASQPNITSLGTLTGLTTSGDINFGDNDKAVFGAGSDLQIYHDGTDSFVADAGTGRLILRGSSQVRLETATGTQMISADDGGAAKLYHNGIKKLETTSTGIDVTGAVNLGDTYGLQWGTGNERITGVNTGNSLRFVTNNAEAMRIDSSGNVGIGVSSPSYELGFGDSSGVERFSIDVGTIEAEAIHVATANRHLTFDASGPGSRYISFKTGSTAYNGTEKVRIDSSGNVGIGTTSPNAAEFSATPNGVLEVEGTKPVVYLSETDTTDAHAWLGVSNGVTYLGSTGSGLQIRTGTDSASTKVTIDTSGNVGIGTSSPSQKLEVSGTDSRIYITSANTDIDMDSSGNGQISIDGNGYAGAIALNAQGMNIYTNSPSRDVIFGTDETERVRIDGTGNLLVGKTAPTISTTGVELRPNGQVFATQSGNYPLLLNRTTSDGDIVQFRKDGTTVGSIGSRASAVSYIVLDPRSGSNGGVGLGTTGQALVPCDYAGANVDGTKDLGAASARFKDLYLGGGVHLGGTGSANELDDYEEGTWTPTWTNGIGNGSTSGTYVKVGNIVHVTALFTMGSTTSIGNKLEATNLPFNCDSITYSGARYENYQSNSYIGMTRANANVLRGYVINVGGSQATEVIASTNAPFTWGVNDYAQLSITYTI
jgi:cytoskeletal protein CcmA (bactofilin family)